MSSEKTPLDKVHAAGSVFQDFAVFHQRAIVSIPDALAELSWSYPALALKAARISDQFSQQNHLQSISGSMLNNSRNAYTPPRAATDAIIKMVSDPQFEQHEIWK